MGKKVVIVGGVAGGATAADRLRRLDEEADIVLLERGDHISFANCGLPYYIGDEIRERDKLLLQTPERMRRRFNIDVRVRSEVVRVDPVRKTVTVRCLDGKAPVAGDPGRTNGGGNGTARDAVAAGDAGRETVYEETYDVLLLSPGARPMQPPIPGIDSERVHTLRNMADADRIRRHADRAGARSAIVIGGGFIGVEMAENLRRRGLEVTLAEAAPHILAPFDDDMVPLAERELTDHGVRLVLGNGVVYFAERDDGLTVTLQNGETVRADLALLAIGVTPDVAFLEGSGIALGPRGHILVNDRMQTNLPDIYAVGDAVEVTDFVHGGKTAVPLAGPANKQARIAADNICGIPSRYKGAQGTSIVKVFGLTAASTGLNERMLRRLNIPYRTVHLHPGSHAGYYPGASPLSLKLLFADDGRILGAQALGRDGVDKRIDVIAAVMRLGGTVRDLAELELAYAPPYSSAKDPVNMAGWIAGNVLDGRMDVVTVRDLDGLDRSRVVLVDVRTAEEHARGHIPGSVHIPVDELRDRLGELPRDKEIWVYCQVGQRGYYASRLLAQKDFRVKNLSGGYRSYVIAKDSPGTRSGG
jgi:NADPH-dependent 2,4-dienoyl-CoA reductase/sulfur reductase-like enzyme/rhodanese-related sulfurtransferase